MSSNVAPYKVWSVGAVVCGLAALAMWWHAQVSEQPHPSPAPSGGRETSAAGVNEPTTQPTQIHEWRTPETPVTSGEHSTAPSVPAQPAAEGLTAQTGYWNDPSVEASMREEPPLPPLPPAARPQRPAIDPPESEWHRLRRREDAIAY